MELVDISLLKIKQNSIKKENTFLYNQLKKSLTKYGQLFPIIVNSKKEIISGYKIYAVCIDLGIKQVWINEIETNEDQLYLELNLLNFELDTVEAISKMTKIDIQDNCLSYTKQEIIDFIELLEFDWSQYRKKIVTKKKLF